MRPEENRKYIEELVRRYDDFGPSYRSGTFNEAQLRKEYIDVLFRALGWDVDNSQSYSESYKEVVHEDPIKLRGTTGHIDYSFRIGGVRKFIVETKKPAVNVRDDRTGALQLRTYAWNARLPLNILTDFEEWAIYDCTKKPAAGDTAATARIEYFTYRELPEKWDHLVGIFSKEGILQGSFDRFVSSTKGKKGTVSVDKDILALIESWRDLLARNLALRNPALTVDDLNIAVQRIIDRIIFLRICEDRGIETYETLKGLLEGDGVYDRLRKIFERADDRYNSGLFHFSNEPGWDEMPDSLTLGLAIDDKVLREVIKRLYWPESQYEFSVIPPAILGQVYEQFLGKVIRLTENHQAKVEFKPEVKKAGGVFYTPEYIVDYIVKETVGRLVEGKTPAEVSSIHVLDPACGSGSFLIGAYEYLLDWHLDWYIGHLVPLLSQLEAKGESTKDPKVQALLPLAEVTIGSGKKQKTELRPIEVPVYRTGQRTDEKGKVAGSYWRLSTAERKRILLNNIYGVDIDQQAVEVTKLSLLLKVLEDETTIGQRTLGTERVLPSLHKNIRCGNSLIGRDVLATGPLTDEEIARINPFDWDKGFPAIMAAGGFDAVIGNPPYVRQETLGIRFKNYMKDNFESYSGTADIYVYFLEKGHRLLKPDGLFGVICANRFMRTDYGRNIRRFLTKNVELRYLIDFGELKVFQDAATFPLIIISRKREVRAQSPVYAQIKSLFFRNSLDATIKDIGEVLPEEAFGHERWTLTSRYESEILLGIEKSEISLARYINGKIIVGLKTGLNSAFIIDESTRERYISIDPNCEELIKPYVIGDDIRKYNIREKGRYLILIPKGWTDKRKNQKNAWEWMTANYPTIANHLKPFQKDAEKRSDKGDYWWELRACDYYDKIEEAKIIYPEMAKEPRFTFDAKGTYSNNKTFFIPGKDLYLLGLLNSKLLWLYFKRHCSCLGDPDNGGRLELRESYLMKTPIRPIDSASPDDLAKHDRMVILVEKMLDLHRRLPAASTEHARRLIEVQVEATDREIDDLVYDLYGLTPDEIAVVEAAVAKIGGPSRQHVSASCTHALSTPPSPLEEPAPSADAVPVPARRYRND